jgi:hypothetical protein
MQLRTRSAVSPCKRAPSVSGVGRRTRGREAHRVTREALARDLRDRDNVTRAALTNVGLP